MGLSVRYREYTAALCCIMPPIRLMPTGLRLKVLLIISEFARCGNNAEASNEISGLVNNMMSVM